MILSNLIWLTLLSTEMALYKIGILKDEWLTNKIILQKLSIPLKTLERHITKMRKNNLI